MRTWTKWMLGGGVAAVAVGGAAMAFAEGGRHMTMGGPGGPGGRMAETVFKEMDRGAKGHVTREDVAAYVGGKFAGADADKNGFVSEAEATAFAKTMMSDRVDQIFDRFDSAKTGRIDIEKTLDGIANDRRARFVEWRLKRADLDRDGFLTRAEADKALTDMLDRRASRAFDWIADDAKGLSRAKVDLMVNRRFERLDADKDGKVTKAEIAAAAPRGGWRHGGPHQGWRHGMMQEPGGGGEMRPGFGPNGPHHPGMGHGPRFGFDDGARGGPMRSGAYAPDTDDGADLIDAAWTTDAE